MSDWAVADAKNRFSELVTKALEEGPQRVKRRGEEVVVMSAAAFEQRPAEIEDATARPAPARIPGEKRVLLIIGGGIAAYKSLELIRLLAKAGVKTRAILTKAGQEFVTPLSVSAAHRRQSLFRSLRSHRRSRDGPYRAFALGRSRRRRARHRRSDRQGCELAAPTISPPPLCSPPTSRF